MPELRGDASDLPDDKPAESRVSDAERIRELDAIGQTKAFDVSRPIYNPLDHIRPGDREPVERPGDKPAAAPPPIGDRPQLLSLADRIRAAREERFGSDTPSGPTASAGTEAKPHTPVGDAGRLAAPREGANRSDSEELGPEVDQPDGGDDPERERVWQTIADEIGEVRSYRNYRAARDDLGTREGEQIHHIVEQSQALPHRSGFDLERINTTDNLVRLPRQVHERITAEYNSKVPGLGIKLRDTLDKIPFDEQWRVGAEVVDGAYEKMKGKLDER